MAAEAEAHWDAMSQMPYWEAKTLVHLHEQGFATITTLEDFEAFRAKKLSAKTLMDAVVAVGGLEVHESANKKIRCTPGKCRRDELGIKVYKAYELENPADYKYDRETIFFSNGEETDFVPERICGKGSIIERILFRSVVPARPSQPEPNRNASV